MPCSSSQKLCRAGERECATGQPMMPASRVFPVSLIPWSSGRHRAALAQKAEQFYKRQAENRKVVARDSREELHASALDAIAADRAQQCVALGRDIGLEKGIAE